MATASKGDNDDSWLKIVKFFMVEAYKATKYGSYYILIAGICVICRINVVRTPDGTLPNEIVRIAAAAGFVIATILFFALLTWDFLERIGLLAAPLKAAEPIPPAQPASRQRNARDKVPQ